MAKDFQACQVHEGRTLRDALAAIDQGACGIALAVDDSRQLKGTLTDGDVRRALLAGEALDCPLAPYVCRTFTAVGPEAGRAEVLDLMRARMIDQVPIVDGQGRLIGLHTLHEVLGAVERPNWAVLMAGGLGSRLLPLTERVPKPMLEVAGRPILERLVLHLVGFGISRIFLAIHHLGHRIEEHFQDGSRFGCRIDYLREEKPLGTGGALTLLPDWPDHPIVVMNGDLVTQVHVADLLMFHDAGGYSATLAARSYAHQIPFGCVQTLGPRLARLEEKPVVRRLINAGIYVIGPESMRKLPEPPFTVPSLLEEILKRREAVGVFEMMDAWIDIGQHDQLRQARDGKA